MYHTFTFISILVVIKTTLSFNGFQNSEMQIRRFYKKKKEAVALLHFSLLLSLLTVAFNSFLSTILLFTEIKSQNLKKMQNFFDLKNMY